MVLSTCSDTTSEAADERIHALDYTLFSPHGIVDLGACTVDPSVLIGISSQWSTALWDSSSHQLISSGSCDDYSSSSSTSSSSISSSSEGGPDGNQWLPFGTTCPFYIDPHGIESSASVSSDLSDFKLWPLQGGLSPVPSGDVLYPDNHFGNLGPLPLLELSTSSAAFLFSPAPSSSLEMEVDLKPALSSTEDSTLGLPHQAKKKYVCPYPQCHRVWKTAQALAYALCITRVWTTAR
jgi:hypothetical protein